MMLSVHAVTPTVTRGQFSTSTKQCARTPIKRASRQGARRTHQVVTSELLQPAKTAEKLNGRLAMLGFLSGSGLEEASGMNYLEQAETTWPFVVFMVAVIGFATLKTRNLDVVEKAPFTTNLELLNGRMAMLGLLCKFVYDSGVIHM